MRKPLTEQSLLLQERSYYHEQKVETMNMPGGDIRNIKMEGYSRIIDILNAALFGNERASTDRIQGVLNDMEERLKETMEWKQRIN